MKYVILEDEQGGKWPFVFPDFCVHAEVADHMRHMMRRIHSMRTRPHSAGFFDVLSGEAKGYSESMSLGSKPTDAAYILLGSSVTFMPESVAASILAMAQDKQSKGGSLNDC